MNIPAITSKLHLHLAEFFHSFSFFMASAKYDFYPITNPKLCMELPTPPQSSRVTYQFHENSTLGLCVQLLLV